MEPISRPVPTFVAYALVTGERIVCDERTFDPSRHLLEPVVVTEGGDPAPGDETDSPAQDEDPGDEDVDLTEDIDRDASA